MAKVLIVDDSAGMRRNLEFTLTRAGHEVVAQASNGKQAYSFYKVHQPDIVTMDITMPEMNGIEATKLIIRDFPDANIIMVSALDQKEMVLEALKYGAKNYIIKPINPERLRTAINKLLGVVPPPAGGSPAKGDPETVPAPAEKGKNEALSTVDSLTGIPNRNQFYSILAGEWNRAARDKTPVSLLVIDIDHLKDLNESAGHLAGDECIRNTAKLIAGNLKRPSDIAARFGGDEFTVILPGTDGIGSMYVAEFIRSSVEAAKMEHPASPLSGVVTVSIGVGSIHPTPVEDVEVLIKMAEEKLAQAKQQGRNRVVSSS